MLSGKWKREKNESKRWTVSVHACYKLQLRRMKMRSLEHRSTAEEKRSEGTD